MSLFGSVPGISETSLQHDAEEFISPVESNAFNANSTEVTLLVRAVNTGASVGINPTDEP
jgi:hypothetical protein